MTGNNGLAASEYCFGAEWLPAYDELLGQIAATNVVDADWPILRDMIKYKLSETIKSYLDAAASSPSTSTASSLGGGHLTPEQAFEARNRACILLDSFSGPPFTVQRLCELLLHPFAHYPTSLPKYLRAISRVTNVTSPRSAFTEDDSFPSSLPPSSSTDGSRTHTGVILAGGVIPTRRPAAGRSPVTSPKASPVVVPLLSPIPWLVKGDEAELDKAEELNLSPTPPTSSTSTSTTLSKKSSLTSLGGLPPLRRSSAKALLPSAPITPSTLLGTPSLPPPPPTSTSTSTSTAPTPLSPPGPKTTTPTGGLVDEVDLGSGGSEVGKPIALTHAVASEGESEGVKEEDFKKELARRFVRASSPKVEGMNRDKEEEEEEEEEEGGDESTARIEVDEDGGEKVEKVEEEEKEKEEKKEEEMVVEI